MDGVAFKFKLEGALGAYIPKHPMQIPGQTRLAALSSLGFSPEKDSNYLNTRRFFGFGPMKDHSSESRSGTSASDRDIDLIGRASLGEVSEIVDPIQ